MSHMQVRADEATTNHEENIYGLFSLSADAETASASNLLFYAMVGIAVLGIYLQYKSWKASRTTKRIVRGGTERPSLLKGYAIAENHPQRHSQQQHQHRHRHPSW